MPTNVKEFNLQLTVAEDNVEKELVKFHKEVVHAVYKQVVELSPVWSGEFRANNTVSIGTPDATIVRNPAKPVNWQDTWPTQPQTVLAAKDDAYVSQKLGSLQPYQNVYISNFIEYATEIEGGHSKQAASGVYLVAATIVAFTFKNKEGVKLL